MPVAPRASLREPTRYHTAARPSEPCSPSSSRTRSPLSRVAATTAEDLAWPRTGLGAPAARDGRDRDHHGERGARCPGNPHSPGPDFWRGNPTRATMRGAVTYGTPRHDHAQARIRVLPAPALAVAGSARGAEAPACGRRLLSRARHGRRGTRRLIRRRCGRRRRSPTISGRKHFLGELVDLGKSQTFSADVRVPAARHAAWPRRPRDARPSRSVTGQGTG